MAREKYDIGGTNYTRTMDEKTTQYNNLVRRAERINRERAGEPSKEEATFYYQASKVCEEIMNLNISQRAVYSQWKMRRQDCEEQVKRISNIIAPPPPPSADPQPISQSARQGGGGAVKQPASRPVTKAGPGYEVEIMGECKDVPADTIKTWFQEKPKRGFEGVSGLEDLKDRLMNEAASMGWDILDETLGISPVQSYFFYGPPGSGKTHIINAFAKELMDKGFKYMRLVGGDIHASLVGVAEKTVKIAFENAAHNDPCLIFIDEIEGVCVDRDQKAEGHEKRLTVAFLEAYNILKESGKRVIFMGATNHPGAVDSAMLDRITLIKLPLPPEEAREAYFSRSFGQLVVEEGFSFAEMASMTDNYSYRDLDRLKHSISIKIKRAAIDETSVTNDDGSVNQEETDILASEAVKSGRIVLTRAMFEETQSELPPSDKSRIREELREFEEKISGNQF